MPDPQTVETVEVWEWLDANGRVRTRKVHESFQKAVLVPEGMVAVLLTREEATHALAVVQEAGRVRECEVCEFAAAELYSAVHEEDRHAG